MNRKIAIISLLAAELALASAGCAQKSATEPWRPIGSNGNSGNNNDNTSDFVPSLPTSCMDEQEGAPVITSLSVYSGPVGTEIEINGCNFSGFEGDKNAWIENEKGEKGIFYGKEDSTAKLIKVTLTKSLCQEDTSYTGWDCEKELILAPGKYKIYVLPWAKESNKVDFTIK